MSVTGTRMASMDADTDTIAKAKPNRAVRKVSSGAIMIPPALAPFQRPTQSQPTASVEPRRDDDVDCCAAHRGPPNGHHGERCIYMPRLGNKRDQHYSARHRDGPRNDDFSCPMTIEKRADPEEQQGGFEN
jgi:hypothetical protein